MEGPINTDRGSVRFTRLDVIKLKAFLKVSSFKLSLSTTINLDKKWVMLRVLL